MVVVEREVGLYDDSARKTVVRVACKGRNSRSMALLSAKTSF